MQAIDDSLLWKEPPSPTPADIHAHLVAGRYAEAVYEGVQSTHRPHLPSGVYCALIEQRWQDAICMLDGVR
jgi:hypothetical protein